MEELFMSMNQLGENITEDATFLNHNMCDAQLAATEYLHLFS